MKAKLTLWLRDETCDCLKEHFAGLFGTCALLVSIKRLSSHCCCPVPTAAYIRACAVSFSHVSSSLRSRTRDGNLGSTRHLLNGNYTRSHFIPIKMFILYYDTVYHETTTVNLSISSLSFCLNCKIKKVYPSGMNGDNLGINI